MALSVQQFQVIQMVTRESLRTFENRSVFVGNVTRKYDKEFGVAPKIGTSLRVRLPNRYKVGRGAAIDTQLQNEQVVYVPIISQNNIGFDFSSSDLTLKIDDIKERYIDPAVSQLAQDVDEQLAQLIALQSWQSVGTPGTDPSSVDILSDIGRVMNWQAIRQDMRSLALDPNANSSLFIGTKGYFNPQGVLTNQWGSGMLESNQQGFDRIRMTQNIYRHITGTRNATGVSVSSTVTTEGSTTITLTGLGDTKTILKGDVFSIDGTYTVNFQSRRSTTLPAMFVVAENAVSNSRGTATITVLNPMYSASQTLATITRLPVAGDSVVFWGAPDSEYAQHLAYHRDEVAFVTATLPNPGSGVEYCYQEEYNGVNLRILRGYLPGSDQFLSRMDVLWGGAVLRGQGVVRVWGR